MTDPTGECKGCVQCRKPQGEPSDAHRLLNDLALAAHGANSRSDDADFLRGHIEHAVPVIRAALRAARSSPTNDAVHAAMEAQQEFMLPMSYGAMRAALRAAWEVADD